MADYQLSIIGITEDESVTGYIMSADKYFFGTISSSESTEYIYGKHVSQNWLDLLIDGKRYASLSYSKIGHTTTGENYEYYVKVNEEGNEICSIVVVPTVDRENIRECVSEGFKAHLSKDDRFNSLYERYFGSKTPIKKDRVILSYQYKQF